MKVKRLLVFMLSCAMTAAVLAGCGGSSDSESTGNLETSGDSKEAYEATFMYWVGNDAKDTSGVEEAFNKLTMRDLNMKVHLVPITLGTYTQQIQMTLSSNDALDILPIFGSNAGTYIDSQYLADMSPYLEKYGQDLIKIIGQEDIDCCKIGDFLWGVPTMHERTNPVGYVFRTDLLAESGFTADDIKTMGDITPVFAKVKELHPDMVMYNGTYNVTEPVITTIIDGLGNNYGVLEDYGQTTTVTNWYESDAFRKKVDVMREWFTAGYSSQDLATNSDSGESLMKAGNLFCFSTLTKPNSKVEKDAMTGYDTTIVTVQEQLLTSATTSGLGYCIANNTKNPEKAMELLNWIYKTKEANDLINWGVEGTDWVETEDGTITYPKGIDMDSVSYHQDFGWAQPNQYNSHVWVGNDADVWEQYQEARNNATMSKAYGFIFDTADIINEIVALTAVSDQYLYSICAGSVDPDTTIGKFNDALYAAGLQTVMDEKQRQLDEWLAKQ